jgi:hypothetical protein
MAASADEDNFWFFHTSFLSIWVIYVTVLCKINSGEKESVNPSLCSGQVLRQSSLIKKASAQVDGLISDLKR